MITRGARIALIGALLWPAIGMAADSDVGETPEVEFSSADAKALRDKAAELGSPANIYEHVRNETEFVLYQGSRGGSINSFLGKRANDVDTASTLIAMLRSRGIPARYAVGTVRIEASKVMSWLGVKNLDLAVALLRNQGIQNVVLSTDRQTVDLEHAWAEALVSLKNYRGAGPDTATVNCASQPAVCTWVGLAPAFKLRVFHNQNIDVYSAVNFDYTRYYNAIKNNDTAYRDKNPLEIYQEQVLEYLRANKPGKTLKDVADPGTIIREELQLLPVSLPFQTIGSVRRYNSVADHDAATTGASPAEKKTWKKRVLLTIRNQPAMGGSSLTVGPIELSVADLATKRLTVTFEPCDSNGDGVNDNNCARMRIRKDGAPVWSPITLVGFGSRFTIDLALDGAPAPDAGTTDRTIAVTYSDLIIGGYYLVGTGGHTSNWSQVHRASGELLGAARQYPVVNDPDGIPYVDANGNGAIDSGETRLLDDSAAMDALTGGLLYAAMNLYFTRFHDSVRELDGINHVISPIEGFVGVVSTTNDVEYIDDTAFSVMPGGLLIDMKGVSFLGPWRVESANTFGQTHFDLLGHVGSSLEHEIWQELTGYDAVSTVRGIQMALANNAATLLNPRRSGATNTFPNNIAAFGFASTVPAPFTLHERTVFATRPATWGVPAGQTPAFDVMKASISTSDSTLRRSLQIYPSAIGVYGQTIDAFIGCVDQLETELTQAGGATVTKTFCDGSVHSGPATTVKSELSTFYNNVIELTGLVLYPYYPLVYQFFDYFDENQGFAPSAQIYRAYPPQRQQHPASVVKAIRDDLYLITDTVSFADYIIPSTTTYDPATQGNIYDFSVYIRKVYNAPANTYNLGFLIQNLVVAQAGGGYVEGDEALTQHGDVTGTVFNNEVFTDQNLNALANNDLIRTASTADPVSTVTGNMYHDETDVVLKGRGLNYSFTRTYNSGTTKTDTGNGPLGSRWTHSYNMRLVSNDYGRYPNTDPNASTTDEYGNGKTSSITYVDERGGEVNYLVSDLGTTPTWAITAPRGVFDSLTLNSPVAGQYTLAFRNGVQYVFEGPDLKVPGNTARLVRIQDPYGNTLFLTYNWRGRLSSVFDNLGISGRAGLTFGYEMFSGRLSSVSDWTGRSWRYSYEDGNLASVTNPRSETITYTYQPGTPLLATITLPQDRNGQKVATTFRYYRNNKTFDYTNMLGQVETLDYDLYRKRTRVSDPRGFVREHYYDDDGSQTKLLEPDGSVLLFDSNADGLRFSKIDGLGYRTQYSYRADRALNTLASDTYGKVTKEVDPLGQSVLYEYDLFDQIKNVTDKSARVWQRTYYQTTNVATGAIRGRLYRVFSPISTTVPLQEYTYYANGNVKQQVEYIDVANTARKRITDFTYDASGLNLLERKVTGSGQTVRMTFTYDALGRKLTQTLHRRRSATDATMLQLTTTHEYDGLDRVVRITDPLGNIAETVYDANGRVTEEKVHYLRPNATFDTRVYSRHEYDLADRRTKTTDIEGYATTFTYNATGNVIASTDANGHTTRYEYDSMNRRTAVIAANGYRSEMVYDLGGRLIKSIDANGNASRMEYDALGRSTKVLTALGNEIQMVYDANGNLTKVTDANAVAGLKPKNTFGASVYNAYDVMNRVTSSYDALNGQTTYTYDLLGNVLTIRDAELHTTTMVYDDLGRLIQVKDPLVESPDKTTNFAYDEAGNLLTVTDRKAQVTRNTYDNLNRLTLTEFLTDGTQETRNYNIYGNLESIANTVVTYTYEYDTKNRLTRKTDTRLNKSLAWTYDPVGMVRTKTDYQGEITTYQYDSTNRLVSQINPGYVQVSYHYDAAGRLLDRILSNGARTEYAYDADNRLTELKSVSASGAVVQSQTYGYDRLRNITSIVDGGGTTSFGYDALYRLTNASYPGGTYNHSYTYDKVGNRKTRTAAAIGTVHYGYDANNRLYSVYTQTTECEWDFELKRNICWTEQYPINTYSHDDNGSRIQKRNSVGAVIQTYAYDQKRRITQLVAGGTTDTFQYDPTDYRIQKVSSAGTKKYLLEAEHLEATYDQNNQLLEKYLRGAVVDEIVYGYRNEGSASVPATYHHDHLQSAVAMTGHEGSTQETIKYDPFGNVLARTGTTTNDLNYTGRERDRDTGLYYYRARYYDPEVGRFLGEDPLGFKAGINFYAYVNNNPINGNDPSGLDPLSDAFGVGFYVGAVLVQDIYSGFTEVNGNEYLGAVAGGIAAGEAFTYTGGYLNLGTSVPAFALTGTAVTFATTQTLNYLTDDFSLGDFATDLATDTLGFVFGDYLAAAGAGVLEGLGITDSIETYVNEFSCGCEIYYGAPDFSFGQPNYDLNGVPPTDNLSFNMDSTLIGPFNAGASGGYVLYPGRANANMMSGVYSKGP